uniref:Uncharacterized protein n=1 Tax=Avena sativa TaxID=4498 RepID=A0ACD5UQY6_AVESA
MPDSHGPIISLVSPEWEVKFPVSSLRAETRVGSDHTPLMLDTGKGSLVKSNRFFLETKWFSIPGFAENVKSNWLCMLQQPARRRDAIDLWYSLSRGLRQFLRGWAANLGKTSREAKAAFLGQIQELDVLADAEGLDEEGWALRYHLENQLIQILVEEEHRRQRGRQKWLLKGDTNIAYFHATTNGRRRKCSIMDLSSKSCPIMGKEKIQNHIYEFYMGLMRSDEPKFLSLGKNWEGTQRVSMEDNNVLALTFTMKELEEILAGTKTATTPGLDGF